MSVYMSLTPVFIRTYSSVLMNLRLVIDSANGNSYEMVNNNYAATSNDD